MKNFPLLKSEINKIISLDDFINEALKWRKFDTHEIIYLKENYLTYIKLKNVTVEKYIRFVY